MHMFNIENYLSSFSNNVEELDISDKNLIVLPDLSRFFNLKKLICDHNYLTSLPPLNENLEYINCSYNHLTSLHSLPYSLEKLY